MAGHPEVYILRHGETEWNAANRMQGWLDSPLTALGEAQAARQGAILRDAGAEGLPVWCSPQGRALTTARIALPDVPLRTDDRLREITLGAWDGKARDEIGEGGDQTPVDWFWWYDTTPGERFAGLAARTRDFVDTLAGPAVIVTHGITSRFLRGALLGLGLDEIAALPGGQGVVHHVKDGAAHLLE